MQVWINGTLYNPEETPVVLVFYNDDDRKTVARQITDMQGKDGVRLYGQFPDEMTVEDRAGIFDQILSTK